MTGTRNEVFVHPVVPMDTSSLSDPSVMIALYHMDRNSEPGNKNNNNNNNNGSSTQSETVEVANKSNRTTITASMHSSICSVSPNQAQEISLTEQIAANANEENDESKNDMFDPPMSNMERCRDVILRTLDLSIFQYMGIVVILGVIIDGALFFFLLIGLHTLCHPVTDCEPRNTVYNISIQILNGFFTYMALLSLPWRLSNFFHLSNTARYFCCCCSQNCYPQRSNDVGHDLYGHPDTDIWFHIPINRRFYITILLLCNCLFQFINHGTRIVHLSYEEQDVYPGNVWTNVFFVLAFACAGAGAIWIMYESSRLRHIYPNKFGYGPIDTIQHWYRHHFVRWIQRHLLNWRNSAKVMKKKDTADLDEKSNVNDIDDCEPKDGELSKYNEMEAAFHHREQQFEEAAHHVRSQTNGSIPDPTRAMHHPSVVFEDRGAMRMFGM